METVGAKKDYKDPAPAPLVNAGELGKWSLYRAVIAEFVATLLFVYVALATVIGHKRQDEAQPCGGVGVLGIAWSFGGTGGHSGYPKISGRVFRVLRISGFQNCYPKFA